MTKLSPTWIAPRALKTIVWCPPKTGDETGFLALGQLGHDQFLGFLVWFTGSNLWSSELSTLCASSALPSREERVCWHMSGAHRGYVAPASADKGAADETDEVNLQVLCPTGEGVTLSVPRSMLVYNLWNWCRRHFQAQSSPCIMWMESWRWIKPWESKGLLESRQGSPALAYQPMCTLHGVMYVGSQLVRESLCSKV